MSGAGGHNPVAQRLLAFASRLHHSNTLTELLEVAAQEARVTVGYRHVWLKMADQEHSITLPNEAPHDVPEESGSKVSDQKLSEGEPPVSQSPASGEFPVVSADSRPSTPLGSQTLRRLDSRTVVRIPLRILDKTLGFFGLGTFGEEGSRPPEPMQLEYLQGMASQMAVAAGRIRLSEAKGRAEEQRRELDRRLQQVQKLESLGMLAGGIAHDFNNLLTVIIASASLAEKSPSMSESRAELRNVLAAAGRARDLTSQLLAMSRSQPLEVKRFDINGHLRRLIALSRRILPESIELIFKPSATEIIVEGDPPQLDQVLLNLLINSRDAMPEGGRITIEIECAQWDAARLAPHPPARPGLYAQVRLSDTGQGMTKDVQERIFDPFFTTKGPQQGTGLGLAVSHGIAQQHGGFLHCESETGVGSSFYLNLPASSSAVAVSTDAVSHAAPAGGGERVSLAVLGEVAVCTPGVHLSENASVQAVVAVPVSAVASDDSSSNQSPNNSRNNSLNNWGLRSAGGRERILIAEDDPLLRRVAVRMLRRAGYQAEAVSNGAEACDATASCHWDALLMDIVMPGMACGEAVSTIQRLRPSMPIVLTSGYTGGANLRELTRLTGFPLLSKPYAPHQVLKALRHALDERRRPTEWSPRLAASSVSRC